MAFDGIVVANLAHELKNELLNGRIAHRKITGRAETSADQCGRFSAADLPDRSE